MVPKISGVNYERRALGRTPALPYDRVVNRLSRVSIPYDHGFPLIGDADRGDLRRVYPGHGHRLHRHRQLGSPDLIRLMLYPTRVRVDLTKLPLRLTNHASVPIP